MIALGPLGGKAAPPRPWGCPSARWAYGSRPFDYWVFPTPAVDISWSDADKAYIAEVPELPGCVSDGENFEKDPKNV